MSKNVRLGYNEWALVDQDTLLAWPNDQQFFDIRPSKTRDTLELRINDTSTATVIYLGDTDTVGQAIVQARKFLDQVTAAVEEGEGEAQ